MKVTSIGINRTNVALFIVAALAGQALASIDGDDFNDNAMGDIWLISETNHGRCWLEETGGRLEMRATSSANEDYAAYVGDGWAFDVSSDFSLKVDFHYSQVHWQDAGVFIILTPEGSGPPENRVELYAGCDENWPTFWYAKEIDNSLVETDWETRNENDGTFYMSYDSARDELYLSHTGYGRSRAWKTVSGLVQGSWESAPLYLAIGGFNDGASLASGRAYLDDFAIDSGNIVWPNDRDGEESSWQLESNMATGRDQFAGAIVGSWMYMFGGNGNPDTTNLATGERYNLHTQTWDSMPYNPRIPVGRGVEEICGIELNGKFYIFGFEHFNEVYDPGTSRWTALATKPTPVSAVVPVAHGGKIYLFGGFHEDETLPDGVLRTEVERYDPSTDTWQYITDIPRVLDSMAVAIHGDSVYLIGGYDVTANAFSTEVMAFNLVSKTWTRDYSVMSADNARMFNWSMTPVIDGKIYLTGGTRNGVPTSKVTVFDIASRTWQEGPPLPEARNGHAAICDGDTIYVVGGYAVQGDLNRAKKTVYRWTPSALPPSAPSSYAFSMDRIQLVGNLPGNIVDEFNDSSVDPQWTIYDPTVTEAGGKITFASPGTVESWQLGSRDVVSEMSYIGSKFSMRDGAGDYEVTSTWTPIIPGSNQIFVMSTGPDDVEEIDIGLANFGSALSDSFGVPEGPVVFFGRFWDIEAGDFDMQSMSILPHHVTGDILLRLTFDDDTNLFTGSFSLDGGATFLSPFSAVAQSKGGSTSYSLILGGESMEVQGLYPLLQIESLPVLSGDITSTSAILRGRILDDAGDPSCLYSFRYFKKSDLPSHGVSTDEQVLATVNGRGDFAQMLEGLEPDCTYVYQASAQNSTGSAVGQYMEFTTLEFPRTQIQTAIDQALEGDTVVVPPGVYAGAGNTNLDFRGKAIHLYGDNGPDRCEIFCDDQSRAFHLRNSEGAGAVMDGFTLTGGQNVVGSAIYCEGASPTLANCVLRDNGPSAVWIGAGDALHVQGTVRVLIGSIGGPGTVQLQNNAILQVLGCPISSSIQGTGRLEILPGAATALMDSALVGLPGSSLVCNGTLLIQDNAAIRNTSIEVADSGQVRLIDHGSLLNCQIHTASDNPLSVNSQTHTGSLNDTEISVTLAKDRSFEVRGQAYCIDPEDPLCGPGAHVLATVPVLDAGALTLSRLELAPNVTVTLTDHFRDQAGSPFDVLYVRDLVLGAGAQLNLAGQRLYYETLAAAPGQIVDQKLYTSQLAHIDLSDPNTLGNGVATNNTPDRTFVSVVDSPDISPEPVMHLQGHDNVPARAKTYLGRFSEDRVIVDFSYLFNSDQPDAVLEVYLSDEEGLLPLDDPHMLLAGHIVPPILGCPGSAESGQFAYYTLPVDVGVLDPNQGLWLELILSEPPEAFGGFGFVTMGEGVRGGAYARDLALTSMCVGICMDLTGDSRVTPEDYTLIGAGSGRSVDSDTPATSPLSCIDRGYSRDGYVDSSDLVNWGDLMARGGSTDVENLCSIPMVWEDMGAQAGSAFVSYGLTEPMAAPVAELNSDLLFLGKGSTFLGGQEFVSHEDLLYGFDDVSAASQAYLLTPNQGQMRLVRGDSAVMILDSDQGLCQLNGDVVVGPGRQTFEGKTVTIGIRTTGDDQLSGRPLRDAAFHNGFAYVVPVIVEESGGILYQAAARLELTDDDYEIRQLYYDSALAPFSNQSPNLEGLREIEVDRSGRVYLLNAHYQNSSDMLWAFDNTGTLLSRHFLNRLVETPLENPVGLCYDARSNRLYIASGVFDRARPSQSALYGYDRESVLSGETLAPAQKITIGNLQHITGISSDQQGTLWATGFTLTNTPEILNVTVLADPSKRPLPGPRLAQVNTFGVGTSELDAISLYGTMAINLPTSVLYVPVPSGPVPVALWRFDELGGGTAQDESGSHPGIIHGAVPTQGIVSGALQFDGTNDYVDCGSSSDLMPEAMTLSLWVYPDALTGFLIHKSGSGAINKDYELSLSGGGIKVAIGGAGRYSNLRSSAKLNTGEWSHVAFSYGEGVLSVYINGVLDASKTYDFALTDKGHMLSIGAGNTSHQFQGKIDHVGLYDRVLSEDEIQGLFEEG